LSYEVELLALAVILYLYDSSVLLYSNEAVFTCDGAGRWAVTAGWTGFVFAGRSLCVLNPFTPHRPSFRLHWDFEGSEPGNKDPSWSARVQVYQRMAPTALTAGLALFVLLPLGMFTGLGPYAVVPAVLLLYGSILVALFQARRGKILDGGSRLRFLGFTFECLACPPFGVNMVRRMTLASRIDEPVPFAAVRLLDSERWGRLREHCLSRLDEALLLAVEHSDEHKALEAQKARLSALDCRS
jgi:hypothetical protein